VQLRYALRPSQNCGTRCREKIGTYRHIPGDGSPEPEDLPGQEPPHEADAVRRLVVARDGDVDELKQFITDVLALSQMNRGRFQDPQALGPPRSGSVSRGYGSFQHQAKYAVLRIRIRDPVPF
jgi:hypothetical protein